MKLDCILTAVNENYLYLDFIPIFIKTWKKLYPSVDIKIVLISNKIPDNFEIYSKYIILFEPIENISTAFISQYIRLLYPCLLNYKNGIMITDIDILPMNNHYYTKNIENFENDTFIYLRNVCINDYKQIAMCYNVALNKTWIDIFKIFNIDDIKKRLVNVYKNIHYIDCNYLENPGWCSDQVDLYKYVFKWNKLTKKFIILDDKNTGFLRLDRNRFNLTDPVIRKNISEGVYSDYHCYRPMKKYSNMNYEIYNLLQ
jgi:hypothetical protein